MPKDEWICQSCGCENAAESPHCERCGKPAVADEDYAWACQACGHVNAPELTQCKVCGCPEVANDHEIKDFQRAMPVDPTRMENTGVKTFFTVSSFKLVVMIFVTFGLYEIYWFYKNWTLIKNNYQGCKVMPAARSIFAPIWAYSCFKEIKKSAAGIVAFEHLPIGYLAFAYFLLNALSAFPPPYGLLWIFSFWPLVVVNNMALAVNLRTDPRFQNNDQLSTLNRAAIAIGALLWLLMFYGMLQPHNLPAG